MVLLILICLAVMVVLLIKNGNLEKENESLKKQLEELHNLREYEVEQFKPPQVIEEIPFEEPEEKIQTYVQENISEEELEEERKRENKKKKESKNTLILVTGCLFIILATIVFLMSTWAVIGKAFKAIIILVLTFVFLGASKLAQDKFNLEKASKAFFGIAMAYIPIGLIFCAVFELFGEYLSFNGEGIFLYLTITGILTSVVYYICSKTKKIRSLLYLSFIFQISSVVLFSLIFENNMNIICLNLLLYSFLLLLSTSKGVPFDITAEVILITEVISYIILYTMTLYVVFNTLIQTVFGSFTQSWLILISLILLVLNSIILYFRTTNTTNKTTTGLVFNLSILTLGSYILNLTKLSSELKYGYFTIYVLMMFSVITVIGLMLKKRKTEKTLQTESIILSVGKFVTVFATVLLYLLSYAFHDFKILQPYLYGILTEIMLVVTYVTTTNKPLKITTSVLIPAMFILTGLNILYKIEKLFNIDITMPVYVAFAYITYFISQLIRYKEIEYLKSTCHFFSIAFLELTYLILAVKQNISTNPIYLLRLFGLSIYVYVSKITKPSFKKVISWFIPLLFILSLLDILHFVELKYSLQIHMYVYVLIAYFTYILSQVIRFTKLEYLNKSCNILSSIFLGIVYVMLIPQNLIFKNAVYMFALFGVFGYLFALNAKPVYKYLMYLTAVATLQIFVKNLSFLNETIKHNMIFILPCCGSVGIYLLEKYVDGLKDGFSDGFNIVFSIYSYVNLLTLPNVNVLNVAIFSYSVFILWINYIDKKSNLYNIVPLLGMLPIFYNPISGGEISGLTTVLQTVIICSLTLYTFYTRKATIETVFTAIYLLKPISNIDNTYAKNAIIFAWSGINMLAITHKTQKDIFKCIIYCVCLNLYLNILKDIYIFAIETFTCIGWIILAIVIFKTVLVTYISNKKTLELIENICIGFLYFVATLTCSANINAIVFGSTLILLLLLFYICQYGNLFILTLATICINALIFTREFWFSLPWWLYLLAIGTLLIFFAIRNENSEVNGKINVVQKLRELKEKVDGN